MANVKHSDTKASRSRLGRSRRDQILRQATELFQRRGYSNTSLDDIASAIGIRREGIYYYFDNRAQILLSIVKPVSHEMLERLREIAATAATPAQRLAAAVESHLLHFDGRFSEAIIALRGDYASEREAVTAELDPIWQEYEKLWTDIIREGQARAMFNAELDPRMAYFGIIGMCNSVGRWYQPKGPMPVSQLLAGYVRMALASLRRGELDTPLFVPGQIPRAS